MGGANPEVFELDGETWQLGDSDRNTTPFYTKKLDKFFEAILFCCPSYAICPYERVPRFRLSQRDSFCQNGMTSSSSQPQRRGYEQPNERPCPHCTDNTSDHKAEP